MDSIAKMSTCFWCGECKEIIMPKRLDDRRFKDMPDSVCLDYEPCDKCKENFAKGFLIMEVSQKPNMPDQPEIQEGLYPTNHHWVIKDEAAREIFGGLIKPGQTACFVPEEVAKNIGLYNEQD